MWLVLVGMKPIMTFLPQYFTNILDKNLARTHGIREQWIKHVGGLFLLRNAFGKDVMRIRFRKGARDV